MESWEMSVSCSVGHRTTAPATRVYLIKPIAGGPPISYEKPVRCDEKKKDAGAVPSILFDASFEVANGSKQRKSDC
jgi:hypothetical protein